MLMIIDVKEIMGNNVNYVQTLKNDQREVKLIIY